MNPTHDLSTPMPKMNTGSGKDIPRLELVNICKSYNSLKANDQIHLTVYPGQIHAILGENGAGKKHPHENYLWCSQSQSGTNSVEW